MKELGECTAAEFSNLPNGTHDFAFRAPNGERRSLRIHVDSAKARVREAQFDMWPCEWNFDNQHADLLALKQALTNYWRSHKLPKGGVSYGVGRALTTLAVLSEDFGSWMERVAKLISNGQSLIRVDSLAK